MEKIIGIIGLIVFVGLGYLLSKDKKNINWRGVGIAFGFQLILTFVMVKTPVYKVIEWISSGVEWFILQANYGMEFVFGVELTSNMFVFIISSLCPIIFISAMIGVIYHFGILDKIFKILGKTIAKLFNVDSTIILNYVGNCVFGQTDALMLSRTKLRTAKESVIFATLVGGFASVSASIFGLFISLGCQLEFILISLPLSVFSCLILSQIVMPTKYNEEELVIEDTDKGESVIETALNFGITGSQAVVGIAVSLMIMVSFIYMVNNFIGLIVPGTTLEKIVSIVFYPLALLMGTPLAEAGAVSEILSTRFILNEVVGLSLPAFAELSVNTKLMVTTCMMGFSGLSSGAIQIAAYKAIAPEQSKTVIKVWFKALLVATLATIMTGTLVGLFL